MIKTCLVCNETKDFGSNVNALTCKKCIDNGNKYCNSCNTIRPLVMFAKAGKNAYGNIRYSGECKTCAKSRNAEFYQANKNKVKERTSLYRKANLARYRMYSMLWIKANKTKRALSMKKANKKYSLTAKGFAAIRMSNERYRSLIKGKDTLTASQWLGICDLFSAKCAYCGSNKPLTVDHFVPLTKGGFLTAKNVLPACGSCNSSKGNKNPFEWLENIEEAYRNKIKHYLNEGHKSIELL